ncbi:MAG: universal stress protein, partial [Rhodospirillales bacterium]|nr:universal stress protein [Rhodospirillales bacterium]
MVRFRSLLVIHAGGAKGDAALAHAINLALSHRARLTIAEIVPTGLAGHFFPTKGPSASLRAEAQKRVGAYLALAKDAGLRALPAVLEGKPCSAICQEVAERQHDLVILGGKDRASLGGMLASAAFDLAYRCPCPVWVIKSADTSPLRRVAAVIGGADPGQPLDEFDGRVLTLANAMAWSDDCVLEILRPWDFRGPDQEISRSELLPEMYEKLHAKHCADHAADVDRLLREAGINGSGC